MRTAIYTRVSTVTQSQQHTIEQQIDRLRTYLRASGEALADDHTFRDEGRSGATLKRPALDRLRDQARLGDFDRILVTAPDRLARNYVHQMILARLASWRARIRSRMASSSGVGTWT